MFYNLHRLKKQLKPGDVFLVHGSHLISRIIRIVTDSHWNHATMYIGNGRFIEANNKGVEIKSIEYYDGKEIEIYRHSKATSSRRRIMVRHAVTKVGQRYDFFQILQLFFYFLFGFRGNAREIGTKNKYICSELVAESYGKAGLEVYRRYNPTQVSPGDFPKSKQFRLCVQGKRTIVLK